MNAKTARERTEHFKKLIDMNQKEIILKAINNQIEKGMFRAAINATSENINWLKSEGYRVVCTDAVENIFEISW